MSAISPEKFYGIEVCCSQDDRRFTVKESSDSKCLKVRESRKMPMHILGPRQFWKEFRKQADALLVAAEQNSNSDPLCTFVSERVNGARMFIVAHPEVYYWYYEKLPPERRCSYEVIPEGSPCRLYLDLEYLIEYNPESEGNNMTNTLIDILCAYLLSFWGLPCNRYSIINLESSNEKKFSRHLIFVMKDVAFKDNSHAGRFIKRVCNDILNYIATGKENKVLSNFDTLDLEKLFVESKNGRKLFIDTGVYTRNRHFRIFKATKWGKNSHLTLSQDCAYIPHNKHIDIEQAIFLESLVTYFTNLQDLILLEFSETGEVLSETCQAVKRIIQCESSTYESQYPVLDDYVRGIISPGKIRTIKYFGDTRTLVYETVGYRYCENIGRSHKSNNVFWIVDLRKKIMYQKCHDEECIGFKSKARKVPDEVCFYTDEENDEIVTCAITPDDIRDEIVFLS